LISGFFATRTVTQIVAGVLVDNRRVALVGLRPRDFLLVLVSPVALDAVSVTDRRSYPELGSRAMSKVIEQDVSILSSSKQGLIYLTANDWALVADKATRVQFKKGEVLVQKGKKGFGVFLLLKGTARVQIPPQTPTPVIGPGEICGEMSFLEDAAASANVVADGEVEAFHLDHPTLQSLFELFPHLASRFYRSLATNLSRRLRDVIGPRSEATVQKRSS
jgi:CRP/FNR family transcriptional regulator, cyclic AMP receptor protein